MFTWVSRHLYYPLSQFVQGERALACLQTLERTQWDTPHVHRERQWKAICALIAAAREIPYYAQAWMNCELDLRDWDDFQALPVLRREALRENCTLMQAPNFVDGRVETQTSGSSGSPLRVYHSRTFRSWHEAGQLRARDWYDVHVGDSAVVVWGRPISGRLARWVQNVKYALNNMSTLSAWDLSPSTVRQGWRRLQRIRPRFVYGYPSALHEIAAQALAAGWPPPRPAPRVVMTTAEMLHETQRKSISEAFGAPVSNVYGCAELGAFAHQCPQGGVHVAVENVLVEILNDGRAVPDGTMGDVVLTSLRNFGMPLIRYAVGDVGRLLASPCPCGRTLPLLDVSAGKEVEMVRTLHGKVFSSALFDYANKRLVAEGQVAARFRVIQRALDEFVVELVADGADRGRVEDVFREVLASFAPGARIRVESVPAIERDRGGKMRFFVRDMAEEQREAPTAGGQQEPQ